MVDRRMRQSTLRETLDGAGAKITRRDAELLLRHVLNRDRAWMLAHPEAELTEAQTAQFGSLVERRAAQEPVQYILGRQEFFGLDLEVTPDVLIPRPETELLVEAVLRWAGEQGGELLVVDVGTGTGAIALALASRLPQATVWALDVSGAVRGVVERNGRRTGLAGRVRFAESDLLGVFAAEIAAGLRFDAIVSNPPYVPLADAATLAAEVRGFEPHLALFGGNDGLAVYRRLIPQAWIALRPGGLLTLEIGYEQEAALRDLLAGWTQVAVKQDYAGIARVVTAERGRDVELDRAADQVGDHTLVNLVNGEDGQG